MWYILWYYCVHINTFTVSIVIRFLYQWITRFPVLNVHSDVIVDVEILKISCGALARIEYFSLLLFYQLKISKFNTLFHWIIVFSIPISLWSTQHLDIGSDTNKILLLPYLYPHLPFGYGYGYGYEYWRMWKNDIRIRIGGGFGCGYPRIIRIRWHPYWWQFPCLPPLGW